MNLGTIAVALFIGAGFISWPIVGKYSGQTGPWVGSIVMLGTTAAVVLLSLRDLKGSVPTGKAVLILMIAAVINGIAVYLYAMKAADPEITTAVFVVTVSVSMVISTPVFDWLLNGVIPTLRQIFGFGFAVVAIYLLGR